ncbi:MaoC family dehydratase N-terminal domain-containing protein [Variovorax paradoxus]|nr:MaoC family dehydratase N-terminal domain-containing protein [Variovorax paradoxus]
MSATTQDVYFEDVVIGMELRSESHVVSAADIGRFCDLTRDHHPLHTDADYAQSRGFPDVIAHGLFGLSLMEGLKTALKLYENSSIASLGWDQVRFLRPVVAGDAVHVVFRFTDKRLSARGGRGVVTEALQLVNQRGERVIDAVHMALVACRQTPVD